MAQWLFVCIVVSGVVGMTHGRDIPEVKSTEKFDQTEILDEMKTYILFWTYNDTHVTFEVHVKTRGWVGFGISGNGDMYPADVIIGWVTDNGTTHFSDYHTVGHSRPLRDASQDWFLLYGEENDFGTVLKFVRRVDTCDPVEDKIIPKATARVIFAYGTSDPASEDDVTYHGVSRGTKSLLLRSAYRAPDTMPKDVKYYDFLHQNFVIPAAETTNWCRGFHMTGLGGKHHMIHHEPIITPGNEMLVHHVALYRCNGIPAASDGVSGPCYYNRPASLPICTTAIVTWPIGGPAFHFPDNVGFSIGGPDDSSFYILEIHYNNPTHITGVFDNSGIRITLTDKLRPMEAGLMVMGLALSFSQIIPPNQPAFVSKAYCSENCMRDGMAAKNISEIRIFSVLQHAHLLGTGITTRHFRNGQELEPIMQDDSYDFNFQGTRRLPVEHILYPGDSLRVDCTYDSRKRSTVTFAGITTQGEMCQTIVYYYPRMPLVNCISRPTYNTFPVHGRQLERYTQNGKWENDIYMADYKKRLQMSTTWHGCFGDHYEAPSHAEVFLEKDDQTPLVASSPVCLEKNMDPEKYILKKSQKSISNEKDVIGKAHKSTSIEKYFPGKVLKSTSLEKYFLRKAHHIDDLLP